MSAELKLRPHQVKAVGEMSDGCILRGGVGSGKSLTSVIYYQKNHHPRDIFVITTATLYLNDGFETAVMNRDVLIKLEDGSFHSMDVETFNATYILVDEPQSRNLAIPDNNESMSAMEILEVQDYETIPRKVQAVRLTVANAAAVAEWCNGYECLGVSDKPTTTWVEVPVPQTLFERRHRAYPGDWILRTPQGRYKVVHNASFMSDFRDANRSE